MEGIPEVPSELQRAPSLPTTKKPRTVSLIASQSLNSWQRSLRKTRFVSTLVSSSDSGKISDKDTAKAKILNMSSPPDLPPKAKSPVSDGGLPPMDDLNRPVPSQRIAASFLNPLYFSGLASHQRSEPYHIDERRRSISLSTCSSSSCSTSSEVSDLMSQVTPRQTPTPGIAFRDNDTDSIYFLEKTSPSFTKTERYVDSPASFIFKTQTKTSSDHVYETCDTNYRSNYDKPVLGKKPPVDIFQTMSFKSPLYGTINLAERNNPINIPDNVSDCGFSNDTYDVPGSLPPSYPPPPLPFIDSNPPDIPPRTVPSQELFGERLSTQTPEPPAIPARTVPPMPVGLLDTPPEVPSRIHTPIPLRSNCSTPIVSPVFESRNNDSHVYEPGPRDEEWASMLDSLKLVSTDKPQFLERSRSNTPTNADDKLIWEDTEQPAASSVDGNARSSFVSDAPSHKRTSLEWSSSYTFVGNKIMPKKTEASNPPITTLCEGYIYQIGPVKEISKKWVTLCNGYLNFYPDNMSKTPETVFQTKNIMGLNVVLTNSANTDCVDSELWLFRIYFDDGKNLLLGTNVPSERSNWVQNLSSQLIPFTDGTENNPITNVQVATHLYVKVGVAGTWQRGYLIVHQRLISLWITEEETFRKIHLQQISVNPVESFRLRCERAKEMGPSFHLELPQQVLYFQSDFRALTNNILNAVRLNWVLPPNARLEDQYLSTENIPVIIDKCLNFVSTHGTTLEGIYRLSGSSTKMKTLLEKFSENVWTVHLNPEEYNAHDVASVLKRYLRTLPECLLTENLYRLWVDTSLLEDKNDRLTHLQYLISHLPDVNYQTLRKMIGHLCIIGENQDKNLMPIINLASVFGPTLLYKAAPGVESHNYDETSYASDTIADLITHYTLLFQVEESELEKERKIQTALQKMKEAKTFQKPAGDLLVGVYIYSKDWGTCINVKLSPTTTAREICEYAIKVANVREPLTKIVLMEVVCNGELERLLHHSESVLDVTLSWATWGVAESKGNYLCLKHNSIFDAIAPLITHIQPLSAFGEILYADLSKSSFKKLSFEFTSAKLKSFKNSKNANKLNEWNIEDITWYIGSEKKRNTPTKWSITFIPKLDRSSKDTPIKRTRSNPYFGCAMCFQSEDELYKWIAAFLVGQHPKGLIPIVEMPDLLS